jgi:hypothetical protein
VLTRDLRYRIRKTSIQYEGNNDDTNYNDAAKQPGTRSKSQPLKAQDTEELTKSLNYPRASESDQSATARDGRSESTVKEEDIGTNSRERESEELLAVAPIPAPTKEFEVRELSAVASTPASTEELGIEKSELAIGASKEVSAKIVLAPRKTDAESEAVPLAKDKFLSGRRLAETETDSRDIPEGSESGEATKQALAQTYGKQQRHRDKPARRSTESRTLRTSVIAVCRARRRSR